MAKKLLPESKTYIKVDKNTGYIISLVSGSNVILDANGGWEDITEHDRVLDISNNPKEFIFKDKKLKVKPKLRLIADTSKFEIKNGKVVLTLKAENGAVIPDDITVAVNRKRIKMKYGESLEIKSNEVKKLQVRIEDDRIASDLKGISLFAVTKDELNPVPKDDPIIIEKRPKKNGKA